LFHSLGILLDLGEFGEFAHVSSDKLFFLIFAASVMLLIARPGINPLQINDFCIYAFPDREEERVDF